MSYPRAHSARKKRTSLAKQVRRRFRLELLESRFCLAVVVPAFESLPGADHTIFLDFDGHTVENTGWNSYYNQTTLNANPYDLDGDITSFNSTELARIQQAYERVAEDFRPLQVNVTTVEPSLDRLQKSGSGDTQWGLRVIITKESTMVNDSAEYCGCGGIAYINSFNNSGDLPVWVYTTGGKSIAEAASHEVGHALGLSHDGDSSSAYYRGHGDGDIGWASIMGVGYYENVTQWDDGTFYDSNNGGSGANYGRGPDDLHIITTYNGFGYRADDHGNTDASASLLTLNGTAIDDDGIIETSSDVDVFTFVSGAGTANINVNTFLPGPNLDIQADLYDAGGALVASSNPVAGLNASISATLTAGQYYLHIDGVGVGDPTSSTPTGYSDYASLGSYSISGSIVDPGQLAQISINDVTVNEADGTATLTVSVAGSYSSDVTVDFTTSDGSATAGADYTATSGSLTFVSGGSNTQSIVVPIIDDGDVEGTHAFTVQLSNAAEASITDGQGTVTINDNDTNVSIADTSANEGNLAKGKKNSGGTSYKDMVFVVSLSNAVGQDVTVNWSTADNTATVADNDYEAASGTLTIPAGSTSGSIVVRAIGDDDSEPDETFSVNIDSVDGGAIADGQAAGTILDDDTKNGGGGGGGGKGGGKPARTATDEILVVDELWYFEPPADHFSHPHDHDHWHGDQHPELHDEVTNHQIDRVIREIVGDDSDDDKEERQFEIRVESLPDRDATWNDVWSDSQTDSEDSDSDEEASDESPSDSERELETELAQQSNRGNQTESVID